MRNICFLSIFFLLGFSLFSQNLINVTMFSTGYTRISCISHAGDSRLFIVGQNGYIWICDSLGNKLATPFLDIDAKIKSSGNEQGLLGLAFHPNYATNGYFYVNYTNNSGNTVVARYARNPTNPNLGDPTSEQILLTIPQPYSNHNGGQIKFGPDGYLYIGMGDGGSAGDPGNRAQNKLELLGKMLRIDVDSGSPYGIPPSNPFIAMSSALPEIWSYGLRNPWRFSFDRLNGNLWMADVGQNAYEEIDLQLASSTGGENYGWRCYEGLHNYNTSSCPAMSATVLPVAEYSHAGGRCSITGGYVYRGAQYPYLYGKYFYSDYCTGEIFWLEEDGAGGWNSVNAGTFDIYDYATFGEDKNGELYLGGNSSGDVFKISTPCNILTATLTTTDSVKCYGGLAAATITPTNGVPPYTYTWSNGNNTDTLHAPAGTYTVTYQDANNCPPAQVATITITQPDSLTGTLTNLGLYQIVATPSGGVPPYTYSWSGETDTNDTIFCTSGNVNISCTIMDANGCTKVLEGMCFYGLGIATQGEIRDWQVLPNPASDAVFVTVNFANPTNYSLALINLQGQLVRNIATSHPSETLHEFSIKDLPNGMYILQLRTENGTYHKKVWKD